MLDGEVGPGAAWRHGWESLRQFSPAQWSSLPGWPMPAGSDGTPTRDEVVAYFAVYEARYALPIQQPIRVQAVRRGDGPLLVESDTSVYQARAVVSATGSWGKPYIPQYSGQELFRGIQIHSADYRTPQLFAGKRLFAFVETDGCFADGVSVATGCWFGRRTLRLMDYGKVAATFVDTRTDRAIRIWPDPRARNRAATYAPDEHRRWHMYLAAYQVMPTNELLRAEEVELTVDLAAMISRPGVRMNCAECGEEIINEREVLRDGKTFCRSCAGEHYYQHRSDVALVLPETLASVGHETWKPHEQLTIQPGAYHPA